MSRRTRGECHRAERTSFYVRHRQRPHTRTSSAHERIQCHALRVRNAECVGRPDDSLGAHWNENQQRGYAPLCRRLAAVGVGASKKNLSIALAHGLARPVPFQ